MSWFSDEGKLKAKLQKMDFYIVLNAGRTETWQVMQFL